MSSPPPPGIYVPAVLFFHKDEELDAAASQAHILRLARGGVTGILVQGSNGEAQHLSHDERKHAIALTRRTLDDHGFAHVLVIAGTGAQSTRETNQLCAEAKDAGASHALVLTPSTWTKNMSADVILRFHRAVADASPIPTMVYNFPTVTAGLDLDSDILAELATHPNIVGTKLSCGNIGKIHRLTSRFPQDQFAVFAGRSDAFFHGLLAGSSGTIAALVNIVPGLHKQLWDLYAQGSMKEAMELQAKLGHGDWAIGRLGGVAGVKAVVVKAFGYGEPNVRGPLKPLDLGALDENEQYKTLKELIDLEKALRL